MLPFLKPERKAAGSATIVHRKPDSDEPKDMSGLEAAMEDLCAAHESKDYAAMARAFKAAFEIATSAPEEAAEDEMLD